MGLHLQLHWRRGSESDWGYRFIAKRLSDFAGLSITICSNSPVFFLTVPVRLLTVSLTVDEPEIPGKQSTSNGYSDCGWKEKKKPSGGHQIDNQRLLALWKVPGADFFSRILSLPVLIHSVCDLHEPAPISDQLQQLAGREEFYSIGRRISQWLKQAGSNQDRYIVGLAIQHPRRLFCGESSWQLPMQH